MLTTFELEQGVDALVLNRDYGVDDVCRLAQEALDLINTPLPDDVEVGITPLESMPPQFVLHTRGRYSADDVIAIGAALMRAGLEAKQP